MRTPYRPAWALCVVLFSRLDAAAAPVWAGSAGEGSAIDVMVVGASKAVPLVAVAVVNGCELSGASASQAKEFFSPGVLFVATSMPGGPPCADRGTSIRDRIMRLISEAGASMEPVEIRHGEQPGPPPHAPTLLDLRRVQGGGSVALLVAGNIAAADDPGALESLRAKAMTEFRVSRLLLVPSVAASLIVAETKEKSLEDLSARIKDHESNTIRAHKQGVAVGVGFRADGARPESASLGNVALVSIPGLMDATVNGVIHRIGPFRAVIALPASGSRQDILTSLSGEPSESVLPQRTRSALERLLADLKRVDERSAFGADHLDRAADESEEPISLDHWDFDSRDLEREIKGDGKWTLRISGGRAEMSAEGRTWDRRALHLFGDRTASATVAYRGRTALPGSSLSFWILPSRNGSTCTPSTLAKNGAALLCLSATCAVYAVSPGSRPKRIPTDRWAHIAVSSRPGRVEYYIDGVLLASEKNTEKNAAASSDAFRFWTIASAFEGRIADLAVWPRGLGRREIQKALQRPRQRPTFGPAPSDNPFPAQPGDPDVITH